MAVGFACRRAVRWAASWVATLQSKPHAGERPPLALPGRFDVGPECGLPTANRRNADQAEYIWSALDCPGRVFKSWRLTTSLTEMTGRRKCRRTRSHTGPIGLLLALTERPPTAGVECVRTPRKRSLKYPLGQSLLWSLWDGLSRWPSHFYPRDRPPTEAALSL